MKVVTYFKNNVERALLGVSFAKYFKLQKIFSFFPKPFLDVCIPCCNLNLSLHWISCRKNIKLAEEKYFSLN